MIRRLRLPLAVAALALAVLLAVLARDVRLWERSVRDGDRSFQVTPGPDGLWEPEGAKLGGAARSLLALDDDLELRRAAQLFRRSRPRSDQRTTDDLAEATSARVALSAIQLGDRPRKLRSIAANQLGILALVDALSDSQNAATQSQKAVQKFVEAIRLDPGNAEAMANLELVLTLLQASDPRVDPEGADSRGGGTAAGAGTSSRGRGF